jgi:hypothetical protein
VLEAQEMRLLQQRRTAQAAWHKLNVAFFCHNHCLLGTVSVAGCWLNKASTTRYARRQSKLRRAGRPDPPCCSNPRCTRQPPLIHLRSAQHLWLLLTGSHLALL